LIGFAMQPKGCNTGNHATDERAGKRECTKDG
jgi:hypothetical protein